MSSMLEMKRDEKPREEENKNDALQEDAAQDEPAKGEAPQEGGGPDAPDGGTNVFEALIEKHSVALGERLKEIFEKYDRLHAEDMARHRAEWEARLKKYDEDGAAILKSIQDTIDEYDRKWGKAAEAEKAKAKAGPTLTETINGIIAKKDEANSFTSRAAANFPRKLKDQVERFSEEIKETGGIFSVKTAEEARLVVHLGDTDGMRHSWKLNVAHKAAVILTTAARANGTPLTLGTGVFGGVLEPGQTARQFAAANADFGWYKGRSRAESLDRMIYAHQSMLERTGDRAGYTHIIFIADDSLKVGDAAEVRRVAQEMTERHPNVKWDVVRVDTGYGREGTLRAAAEDLLPNVRVTDAANLDRLPQLLARLAVTPFGVPVTDAAEKAVRTENILLKHVNF